MRKRLLLLDLLLLALLVVVGERVRQRWLEARKRESVVLGQPLRQAPPPPYAPLAPVTPPLAAAYADVAQQMLFSSERNPTVVVEVAEPPKMPDLPAFYGLVNIGDGPTAFMAEKPGGPHKEVRFGQEIGEFKLVTVTRDEIVLEWHGERVTKKLQELTVQPAEPSPAAEAAPPPKPQVQSTQVSAAQQSVPGMDLGSGRRACQPGDNAPAGAVADGYRKVVKDFPFGKVCEWVAVK